MTTDIERQFFETFGIEPKKSFRGCKLGAKFYSEICKEPCKGCENEISKTEYPQITDRILLELICIAMGITDFRASTVDDLKEVVLEVLIDGMKHYNSKELKHQVQALFKEG